MIINVTGGPDLSLVEVNEASCVIQEAAHEDANIIFGAVVDPQLEGKVKITVIATGFDRKAIARPAPSSVGDADGFEHLLRAPQPRGGSAAAGCSRLRDQASGKCGRPRTWLMRRGFPFSRCGPDSRREPAARRRAVALESWDFGARGLRRRERLRGKHAARRARLPAATVVRAARGLAAAGGTE